MSLAFHCANGIHAIVVHVNIALLDPYYVDSHRLWAEGLMANSRHTITIHHLTAAHWKWRMHGGVITLFHKMLSAPQSPDLVVCTDMADIALLRAEMALHQLHIPVVMYFHENQLTYPWSSADTDRSAARDRHYAWLNFSSALVSDAVWFNSDFHKGNFLDALPDFLEPFPDHRPSGAVEAIAKKSLVRYPGLMPATAIEKTPNEVPVILWNHRWEYDKNPEEFFHCLFRLAERQIPFQLVVAGRKFDRSPAIFEEARAKLGDRILHFGWIESRTDYNLWLKRANVLPVTARQEFFGYSVMEAVQHDVYPLLPKRLTYPELIN
ncbi:MAG: DUF3524 domain-containing protein, partial [Flavobacteriales bacterium]|nr:DUF3524 domain-containing protein [Flavobacteriales bacterium]